MTGIDRARRAGEADAHCRDAFAASGAPLSGVALVAVGGYGRGELAPYSDLDVVLVIDDDIDAAEWAAKLWYPLWDSGVPLDHSVRTLAEVLAAAAGDVRVLLGMLDARHVAGDPSVTLRLRTTMLATWRREARRRLPELALLIADRHERVGELAHAAVPDLKESEGGLRDATALRALVATWLVDVPHVPMESSRRRLLDARDVLHETAGRSTDRIAPEYWDAMAAGLELGDAAAAQREVRAAGRRLTHLSRVTWHQLRAISARGRRQR
jgi:[protein-PII] uridylyltransferase